MSAFIDLTGRRFGRFVVIERAADGVCCGKKVTRWLCECDCGSIVSVDGHSLKRQRTKSCGCLNAEIRKRFSGDLTKTHGKSDTRLYHIWAHMKQRCDNPNDKKYYLYGGRGICVCDEWRQSFEAFYKWAIANGYSDDLTIDRIDTNGNYEPENCRWATWHTQRVNQRRMKEGSNETTGND